MMMRRKFSYRKWPYIQYIHIEKWAILFSYLTNPVAWQYAPHEIEIHAELTNDVVALLIYFAFDLYIDL